MQLLFGEKNCCFEKKNINGNRIKYYTKFIPQHIVLVKYVVLCTYGTQTHTYKNIIENIYLKKMYYNVFIF